MNDFTIESLGDSKISSPISYDKVPGHNVTNFVSDDEAIIYDVDLDPQRKETWCADESQLIQKAGPRAKIYFSPPHVHAGIVSCGGLCPGINDVIRAVVRTLWYRYGVRRITGIRNGYKGLIPEYGIAPIDLSPDLVDDIHKIGGSILGTSRGGGERTEEIVDTIERMNLNILFTIGGDGTQKGSLAIAREIERRGLKISIIGIPKTIDNDFKFIQRSFGFETAVARATEAVTGAHVEAQSVINGIGLVKVMGRESGFIAAYTALASHEANFVLIPEVPFELDGPNGLIAHLVERLERRSHAVVIVAEGAGQTLLERDASKTDDSGNVVLGDIGLYLKEKIASSFKKAGIHQNLKYIDPSYMIRSSVAVPTDSVYCSQLGNNAAHAAMAGKTKTMIGLVNNHYVHLPIELVVASRNHVDPQSSLWRSVIEATHQPVMMTNTKEAIETTAEQKAKMDKNRGNS
ncbi:ATP-dependent 6-phosphofructokinase [Spirochaeta africana]|uniref:ATP-dependent 6-phosphofructokinase n=1 Tax=Spirochaeta africana (strain ATCC 700263 / DSM 8902 / Z-7692) TaxID=889378 RepID=H9ULS4_SPIAZ|nr:ATP-dependent 6-phosphofructokinase [Spirochaeta africana]AFG38467.1 6-phosphofructokinase [Spirochaeta africana DSM 8902]